MKRKILMIAFIITLVFLVGTLETLSVKADELNSCILTVTLVNQGPYPAVPDSYVNVLFQISGTENSQCNGAEFKLVPAYPFSLDNGNDTDWKILQGSSYTPNHLDYWNIPYQLRVDKDALDGNATVEVEYNSLSNPNENPNSSFVVQTFNIAIQDSRTTFDSVIQGMQRFSGEHSNSKHWKVRCKFCHCKNT